MRRGNFWLRVPERPMQPSSFADAGWFRRLRDGEMSRVVEADPAQNAIAQGLFTLSFRHDDPEGGFDGAVRLAISPGYFNIFHSDIAPEQGVITLFHENGEMLSRYPPDVAMASDLTQDDAFREAVAQAPSGFDHVSRWR